MNSRKNRYIESIVVSLIALLLLFTEDFAAWQNRDSYYGVVEGYVWIGSTKAFPFAQIGILALSACLLYIAYVSYKGYSEHENISQRLLINAYSVRALTQKPYRSNPLYSSSQLRV